MSPPTKSYSSSSRAPAEHDDLSEYWANMIATHIEGYDPKNAKSAEMIRIHAMNINLMKPLKTHVTGLFT